MSTSQLTAEGPRVRSGRRHHNPLRVLCYHAITDLRGDPVLERYGIPPSIFEKQIRTLKRAGFRFIHPDDLARTITGDAELPPRAILITFDDCYRDLREAALPILNRYDAPALAFAVSAKLGMTNSWDEASGATTLPLLTAEDLIDVSSRGIEIGAHSRTHPRLDHLSIDDVRIEVGRSADELEAAGLPRPRFFCYPYGGHNRAVSDAVREQGYLAAFTVQAGIVKGDENPFELPRVHIYPEDTGFRLVRRVLLGGRPLLPRW